MSKTRGITERPDASGRIRYQARVRKDGRTRTATFDTLAEAVAWLESTKRHLGTDGSKGAPAARLPFEAPSFAVAEVAARLLEEIVSGTLKGRGGCDYSVSALRSLETSLRDHVLPQVGGVAVASLTTLDTQHFVDEVVYRHSHSMARKALTALRMTMELAVRLGLILTNPCNGVRIPAAGSSQTFLRILTPQELAALIAAADAHDQRAGRSLCGPFIRLAGSTGGRLGELLALPWGPEGLDLEAGVLNVTRTLDSSGEPATDERHLLPPHRRAGRRSIPLTREDNARLQDHWEAAGSPPTGSLVFSNGNGRICSRTTFRNAFLRATAEANIPKPSLRFHDIRWTFAAHALDAGASPFLVARLLGLSVATLSLRVRGLSLPSSIAEFHYLLSAYRRAKGVEGF